MLEKLEECPQCGRKDRWHYDTQVCDHCQEEGFGFKVARALSIMTTETDITANVLAIGESYKKARLKHAPMHSPHEGYAILLEEVDELWDEVKRWQPPASLPPQEYAARMAAMRKEALHVAAMALAFLIEVAS